MTDEITPEEERPKPTPPLPPAPEEEPMPTYDAVPAPTPQEKSPALAAILAFIPFGMGHLYLGLYHRAVIFFLAFWFPIYLGIPLIGVFFFFFAIFDAYRQAQLINLYSLEGGKPPASSGQGVLTLGVFLVVVGTVILLGNWIDMDEIRYFLQDYSPAILVLVGIYLIFASIRDRAKKREEEEIWSDGE